MNIWELQLYLSPDGEGGGYTMEGGEGEGEGEKGEEGEGGDDTGGETSEGTGGQAGDSTAITPDEIAQRDRFKKEIHRKKSNSRNKRNKTKITSRDSNGGLINPISPTKPTEKDPETQQQNILEQREQEQVREKQNLIKRLNEYGKNLEQDSVEYRNNLQKIEKLKIELKDVKQKTLFSIKIERKTKSIDPRGDKRKIRITGDPYAVFSLTIKDSSGRSVLKKEIENEEISSSGIYEFDQHFPSQLTDEGFAKTKETYDINLIPAADSNISELINPGEPTIQLFQYADPTITVTNSFTAATIGGNIQVSGSDVTITGPALTHTRNISNYSESTHTLTVSESSSVAGVFYIKNNDFNNNITTNTSLTKVIKRSGETGITNTFRLAPLTTRTITSIENDDVITGDIEAGMNIYAKLEKTKTVLASLDKDNNILDYSKTDEPTDIIELSNTHDILPGMIVGGGGFMGVSVLSVDHKTKRITLTEEHVIKRFTELTFKIQWSAHAIGVAEDIDIDGNTVVTTGKYLDIPHNTVVTLDDNDNKLLARVDYTSGSDSITITTKLKTHFFGSKNTTYILDLDGMVTRKPNAYNQSVTIKKNSSGYAIDMIKFDNDANRADKSGTVTQAPSHGTVGSYSTSNDTFTYTPHKGFTGEDTFAFTMSDGTNASEEKRITITVK